jgi:sec-independent protein translocase protein TatB
MSGVGFWELILVFLIGLIVLGPERLPRVAQQLGTWLGQARRMTRMMRRQLEDELDFEKELSIRPRSRPLPPQRPARADVDDRYSPAHDKSAAGTGVTRPAADETVAGSEAGDAGHKDAAEAASDGADAAGQEKNP